MSELKAQEYKKFEDIKIIRADGSEYWMARELAFVLDYTEWRNFTKVIDKAMIACKNSGREIESDFVDVNKIVVRTVSAVLAGYHCFVNNFTEVAPFGVV